MGRTRTGTVTRHHNHWDIRITLPDGTRSNRMCMPATMSETMAREKANVLTERAMKGNATRFSLRNAQDSFTGESLVEYIARWCDTRESRGIVTAGEARGILAKWLAPALLEKPMTAIGKNDLEMVVEKLDEAVQERRISWKTAVNVWGLVAKLFRDACSSKVRALRVRESNPADGIAAPERGVKKAKTYLFPNEFLTLVSCEQIPLAWRRSIALAVYLHLRASELRALQWEDVDRERWVILVHRSVDREGQACTTKSESTRRFSIEPHVRPLLEALYIESGGKGEIIAIPDDRHLARALRALLKKARVERPDLFIHDRTRKNLTWHDLRATAATWLAIRGENPLTIMQRLGHTEFRTTQIYIREAEAVRDSFGIPFPELPHALHGAGKREVESSSNRPKIPQLSEIIVEAPGIEPPERGLETLVSAGFPHVKPQTNVQTSTPNCAEGRAVDDSRTNRQEGRARMMTNLSSDLHAALEAGDLEAARVANEAMTRLLGGTAQPSAPVVDLGSVRARRTGTT